MSPTPLLFSAALTLSLSLLFLSCAQCRSSADNDTADKDTVVAKIEDAQEDALAKLVKIFSKPGAFKRIDAILGENMIEASSPGCPRGDERLECRRAEARRSVDCPRGDCYCYNCAAAGPQLWPSCCRGSLRCCSHLAAACRTCDHRTLYPFCQKHFNKCPDQPILKTQEEQS